jgi:chaperonin GroES
MKNLQPVNNNVVVKFVEDKEEKTVSGLYIPETAKEKPSEGEVVAISTEVETSISVGDIVIYRQFSGTEVAIDGTDYVILPVDDILAKIVSVDAIPE